MEHQARNEAIGGLAQAPGIGFIIKCILAVFKQAHVDMHTAAVDAMDGLGHKRGMEAIPGGIGLDRELQRLDPVGGGHGLGILKVHLVLPLGHLMMAGLDLKAHGLQGQAHVPADGFAMVNRAQVKIPRIVLGHRGGMALFVGFKQEKFALRANVKGIALGFRRIDCPLEHVPGIAHKGGAVGIVHRAHQPRHLAIHGPPGHNRKGVEIRAKILVGLINAHKALDGTAVDHDLIIDHLFNLRSRHRHVFQHTENVGKLQPDELYVLLFNQTDDVFLGVFRHNKFLLMSK